MSDLPKHTIAEGLGHDDRGSTIVEIASIGCTGDETNLSLDEVLGTLRAALETVPKEFRKSATLHIKAYGDFASASVFATFQRPETNEELADRRRWLTRIRDEDEARDRREFARLSQKYNNP